MDKTIVVASVCVCIIILAMTATMSHSVGYQTGKDQGFIEAVESYPYPSCAKRQRMENWNDLKEWVEEGFDDE